MRKYNLIMAIIFIVINFLPFIFGVCFFFLLIPIPGIIIYIFYWRILKEETSLTEIRNTWLATALYNLLLILIFGSEEGARQLELQMPEQGWALAYQAAALTAGTVMAYLNQVYIRENPEQTVYSADNEEQTDIIENL